MKIVKLTLCSGFAVLIQLSPGLAQGLKYGDAFPSISGQDIYSNAQVKIEKGTWNLVYYVGKPLDYYLNIVKYLGILKERLKNISVLIISDQQLIGKLHGKELSFSVIFDEKSKIKNILAIKESEPAIYFIDPMGKINFANFDFMRPIDIRMLAERYLFGKITAIEGGGTTRLRAGDDMPNIPLRKAGTEDIINLAELKNVGLIVLWTADCTACVLDQYRERLISWGKDFQRPTVIHVFSSKFDDHELMSIFPKNRKGKDEYYIATTEMRGIEDLYYEKSFFDYAVIAMKLDGKQKIKQIDSFMRFIENRKIN